MARTSTPTLSGHSDEWVLDDAEARDKRKQKRAQKGNMKRRRVDEKLFDDAEAEDKRRRKRVRNEKAERKRVDEESFDDLPLGDDDAKSDEGPSRASSLPMVKPPKCVTLGPSQRFSDRTSALVITAFRAKTSAFFCAPVGHLPAPSANERSGNVTLVTLSRR